MTEILSRMIWSQGVGTQARAISKVAIFVVFLAALLNGLFVALGHVSLLALLLLAPFAIWALIEPRIAVTLFCVSVFAPFGYLERHFFPMPEVTVWLPHFLLLLAVVSSLLSARHRLMSWPSGLVWIGVVWLSVAFVSMIVNGSSFIAGLLSLRRLFLIYGSVLVYRLHFSPSDQERWLRLLIWLGLLQLPILILQRLILVEHLRIATADLVSGTFTAYDDLVLLQLFCIMAVTSWWLHRKRLSLLSPPIAIVLLFASLAISNSKAAPLYFFIIIGFLLFLCRSQISTRMFNALLVLAIVGVVGTLVFDKVFQLSYDSSYSVIGTLYNPEAMAAYLLSNKGTTKGGLQRGAALLFNYNLIKKDPLNLLFGLGPGALSDSRVPGGTGYIYMRYPNLALNNNSLSTILGELGLVGIMLVSGLSLGLYLLYDQREPPELIVLRKSAVFLLALLLIYKPMLLSPLVALVLGVISIQPKDMAPSLD